MAWTRERTFKSGTYLGLKGGKGKIGGSFGNAGGSLAANASVGKGPTAYGTRNLTGPNGGAAYYGHLSTKHAVEGAAAVAVGSYAVHKYRQHHKQHQMMWNSFKQSHRAHTAGMG